MALSERTRAYETLIRYNADGTIGSQHTEITEVLRDNAVISAQIGTPMALTRENLTAIVTDANASALLELAVLKPLYLEAQTTITQLVLELEKLRAPLSDTQVISPDADSPAPTPEEV